MWICMREERRRNSTINKLQFCGYRATVLENSNSIALLLPVQYMLEHAYIGARRDRLREICGNQFASGGSIFLREASLGWIRGPQACLADAG